MEKELIKYIGLADAHGIEAIQPYDENDSSCNFYILRAAHNRQRHAVAFVVELTAKQFKLATECMHKNLHKIALKRVKKYADKNNSLYLFNEGMGNVVGSWNLIPNPALDPWRY